MKYTSVSKSIPVPLFPRPVRWAGVVAVAAVIFYGSLVTVPETVVDDVQPEFVALHYWRHLVAYFTLAWTVAYASDHWALSRWPHAFVVIAIVTAYGIGIEFGQSLVPHRTDFLVSDVVANAIGASGVLVWFVVRPVLELKSIAEFSIGGADD